MNLDRREFLIAASLSVLGFTSRVQTGHPEPRPGITGAKVLKPGAVPADYREIYAAVASRPDILDGIRCPCDCIQPDRSLLVCFETTEPIDCGMCDRAAEVALAAVRNGGGLREARAAVDRRFGPPSDDR